MPTNLALDDRLIEAARRAGKHKTKKEAVNAALDEYVRTAQADADPGCLWHRYSVDPAYDYKAERRRSSRRTGRPIAAMMVLVDTPVWSLALRRRPEHLSGSEATV